MPNFCFDNALANENQGLDLAHLLLYVICFGRPHGGAPRTQVSLNNEEA